MLPQTSWHGPEDLLCIFRANNLALPEDRFRAIGGFDTIFPLAASEDREFCDRWLHHGFQMTYAPEAVVYHARALTFRSFWRQHFKYGRGAFHFHQVRARLGGRRWTGPIVGQLANGNRLDDLPQPPCLSDRSGTKAYPR